jgi:ABC-type sugar transport system permease subunit
MTRERMWRLQVRASPYLFVLPFVVLFAIFMLYPMGRSVMLSFYRSAGPREQRFVGWDNFRFLLKDPVFWLAVLNTVLFTVVFLIIQIPAALGLALLLNSRRVRCRNFFRFAFFSSYLVGQVFAAVIFSLLLAPRQGLVNRVVGAIAPFGTEVNWLGNPFLAMPAVILAALWLSVGYAMIYFLAALQGVDRELYEAAVVDGAGAWARFWNVTLPGIRPVLMLMILVGIIGGFQLFELPYVLFQGPGPSGAGLTIVMYLFQQGFEQGDIGYASAVGWVLVLLISVVAMLHVRLTGVARED